MDRPEKPIFFGGKESASGGGDSTLRIVVAPRIFFRGVIQICVEEVDNDLFVNNFFHLDYYDNIDEIFHNR